MGTTEGTESTEAWQRAEEKNACMQAIIDACERLEVDFSESVEEEVFWSEISAAALRGFNAKAGRIAGQGESDEN